MAKIYTKIYNFKISKKLKIFNVADRKTKKTGFTLLETIISLAVFVMVIFLTGSIYSLSQTSYKKNSDLAELTQNSRVCLDRLSRELRQATSIITTLPPTDTDPINPPTDQIIFQDGHDSTQITYIRYYLDGGNLMRQHKAYYFDTDHDVYVYYDSLDLGGEPPDEIILEDRIIGEYFDQIKFWGSNGIINIYLKLIKSTNAFEIKTSTYSRN